MYRFKKKTLAIAAGTLVVLAATGTAYAFWTGGGTGSGTGTTANGVAVTVNQTNTLTAMYPGGAAQTLSGTFGNATGATVHVTSVTVGIAVTPLASLTCTAADYTLASNPMNNGANGWEAAPDSSTTWTGATIQFNDTGANQDGCKGATVTLTYTAA